MGRQIYFNSYGNEIDPPEADEPKQTNADRIRAMSDKELAAFLDDTDGDFPPNVDWCTIEQSEQYWLEWLKQECSDEQL